MRPYKRLVAIVALAGVTLSGCGPSVQGTIPADQLEQGIIDALKAADRPEPDEVECPDAVKAEMAEETTCVMTLEGQRYHVAVVVTTIRDDGTAEYDIEIDEKPMS
ncbi:MAG: DUF4333 domain-containing protein [Haloechinothrix sp.]